MLVIDPHPLLELAVFVTEFPQPLGVLSSPSEVLALLAEDGVAPFHSDDDAREAVRALLRRAGFKPTGRSKPASEYLLRAVRERQLTTINLAVDVCNAVSLHSGLPISVVDCDLIREPCRIGPAVAGTTYVFNPAGQSIDVGNLLCLFDADGPCASPVKDSQRTKTGASTRRTLSIIWGSVALPGRAAAAEKWYRALLERQGATTATLR